MTREQLLDALRRFGRFIDPDPRVSPYNFVGNWIGTECFMPKEGRAPETCRAHARQDGSTIRPLVS